MKNYSKRWLWLGGGVFLLGILGLIVSATDISIDISNAIQYINSVKLINYNENEVEMSNVGNGLLRVDTESNIVLGGENAIDGGSNESTILGGKENRIEGGNLSTIIAGFGNVIGNGSANVILGGLLNSINGDFSVIAGGKENYVEGNASSIVGGKNNRIQGDYSVIVGEDNSITGNTSVAMGVNSHISGNNSFLWTDGNYSDVLEVDDVFVVMSQNGMVINSNTGNSDAQLTLGGSLMIVGNDKDQDIVCEGGTGVGVIKAVSTGGQNCLCSCDGQGRNSMFGRGICKSICDGDTQPVCGTGVFLVNSGGSYVFEGTCEHGNVVNGTGAYLVDRNEVVHWTCQLGNGESVLCSSADITPVYRNCDLPWGGRIAHGESVLAYQESNPAGVCVSQQRTCTDGYLDGNFENKTCSDGCPKPWSNDSYIRNGESLQAWKYDTVNYESGYLCDDSRQRFCDNGTLDGDEDFRYPSCTRQEPNKCEYKGTHYQHLYKLITYNTGETICPDGCDNHKFMSRCYNGRWLNGDSMYWNEEDINNIRPMGDLYDIPRVGDDVLDTYQFMTCKSFDSNNNYTLDEGNCPPNGSCSCIEVSQADNSALIPICKKVRKCKLDSCNAGFFKDGYVCKPCPTGYTSDPGATGQNQCFITCSDRYHLTTHASSCTMCGVGTYRSTHTVNYGSFSLCFDCTNGPSHSTYTSNGVNNNCNWQCNAGYYKNGQSCTQCPTGYTSNIGAESSSDCYQLPVCGPANGQTYHTQNIPVDYACLTGDRGNFSISATGYASWTCSIGSNSVNCGAITYFPCGGTAPQGDGVQMGESTHPYMYSPSSWQNVAWQGTLGACQWRCQSGYTVNGNRCVSNPQCGSANGGDYLGMNSSMPGLCSGGNVGNFSLSDTGFVWTCGYGSANLVNCSADRLYYALLNGDDTDMNQFYWKLVKVGNQYIMDRNLGAETRWDGIERWFPNNNYTDYKDEFGYYYLWGNNYGYSHDGVSCSSSSLSVEETMEVCNCSTSSDCISNNCVYSGYFCNDTNTWWHVNVMSDYNLHEYELWFKHNGYGGYGSGGAGVQGPCPAGYHIPTYEDWGAIYSWCINNSSQCRWDDIASDIFLPAVGVHRKGSFANIYYSRPMAPLTRGSSYYWISGERTSRYGSYIVARAIDYYNLIGSNGSAYGLLGEYNLYSELYTKIDIGLGLPIRCFKN